MFFKRRVVKFWYVYVIEVFLVLRGRDYGYGLVEGIVLSEKIIFKGFFFIVLFYRG